MPAAIKAPPVRSNAPGKVAAVKKLAVSLIRCLPDPLRDSAPVSAIGIPEYLFMNVAIKAPRIEKGASNDMKDRKSTRLNSSHVSISYAVFCLKKKTTHPT